MAKIVTVPVFDSFVKWIIQISLIDYRDECGCHYRSAVGPAPLHFTEKYGFSVC